MTVTLLNLPSFFRVPVFVLMLVVLAGCDAAVLKQSIPVTTNPMGAQVLADGQPACIAPCTVDLTRNQDHILTFVKDGYMQQDVPIRRKYQAEATMMRAVNKGFQDAEFFKDSSWGVNSGVQSIDNQKASGEAYVLAPATVQVRLTPSGGMPAAAVPTATSTVAGAQAAASQPAASQTAASQTGGANGATVVPASDIESAQPAAAPASPTPAPGFSTPGSVSAASMMDDNDLQQLSHILETTPSGKPMAWQNRASGIAYKVIAEPGQEQDGQVVRYFTVTAKSGDRTMSNRYPATRRGPAYWSLGLPVVTTQPEEQRPDYAGAATGLLKSTGNDPTIKKSWSSGSSHTSTSFSNGGMTQKTSSSKVSGSVSVNPLGVIQMLDDFSQSSGSQ